MKIYVKQQGYNSFYECEISISKTRRKYLKMKVLNYKEITKNSYYSQPQKRRFIFNFYKMENFTIHEIENKKFFENVKELLDK